MSEKTELHIPEFQLEEHRPALEIIDTNIHKW